MDEFMQQLMARASQSGLSFDQLNRVMERLQGMQGMQGRPQLTPRQPGMGQPRPPMPRPAQPGGYPMRPPVMPSNPNTGPTPPSPYGPGSGVPPQYPNPGTTPIRYFRSAAEPVGGMGNFPQQNVNQQQGVNPYAGQQPSGGGPLYKTFQQARPQSPMADSPFASYKPYKD